VRSGRVFGVPVVDLVPVVSERTRPVVRIEMDWGGEVVGALEMAGEDDHLMVLTVVVTWPASDRAGVFFRQQVTEKLLSSAIGIADERGAVLSIAVPAAGAYRGFLAEQGFLPLAGEVWRRDQR
jgi:hypothetical protein